MLLLALLLALLVMASCVGIYAEPTRYPPAPDRHARDLDLRRR
jgi:hypothetical protein